MSEITKTYGPITVDLVQDHNYKTALGSAQLRQVVTTTYPALRVGNSKTSNLFDLSQFELPQGQSYESTRITWINVPKGTTVEQVEAALAAKPNSRIYKSISFNVEDVMTEEQKTAVRVGLRSIEEFEEQLRVQRTDENGNTVDIDGPAQYSQNFFADSAVADEDFRGEGLPAIESTTKQVEQAVAAAAEPTTV